MCMRGCASQREWRMDMSEKAKEILVINGPNLHKTGMREKSIYGSDTLDEINALVLDTAKRLGMFASFIQSNFEGEIIEAIWGAIDKDGIIINPGAFGHYSYAIRDALAGVGVPAVEVHMSNIYAREEFRSHSVIAPVCAGQISGFGKHSYTAALYALKDILETKNK